MLTVSKLQFTHASRSSHSLLSKQPQLVQSSKLVVASLSCAELGTAQPQLVNDLKRKVCLLKEKIKTRYCVVLHHLYPYPFLSVLSWIFGGEGPSRSQRTISKKGRKYIKYGNMHEIIIHGFNTPMILLWPPIKLLWAHLYISGNCIHVYIQTKTCTTSALYSEPCNFCSIIFIILAIFLLD